MKILFIILNFFLLKQLVKCNELSTSISKTVDNDLQRENLKLLMEIGQLRKTNAELIIENANLKLELLQTKEKEKILSEENELTYWNCTGLATHLESMTESLTTLLSDVQSFKPIINEKLTAFAKKFHKNNTEEKTSPEPIPKNCVTLPHEDESLFQVACNAMNSNGTWTVIQRRMDGKTNFYRPWSNYKTGFGNVTGEFFLGLDNLHIVTSSRTYELYIDMEDFENEKRYAKYDLFVIGSETEKYALKELGTYSGDAGDSLTYHKSEKFSTYDQDNDSYSGNCAKEYKGAWWYKYCHLSNLNGEYGNNKPSEGINWQTFRRYGYSLKYIEIKIRPKV